MAVMTVVVLVMAIISAQWQTFVLGTFMLVVLGFYLHTTLRGMFLVWAELLDKLGLRGDERILDLGCGRGAALLMAAQRLTTGRAVGIDLWRSADQSGNSAQATQRNVFAEGVTDRVELHTGDMTALPFADNSFDVVVSSLAIHNIGGPAGREKPVHEAAQVLRPGGRLLIADIQGTRQHHAQLAKTENLPLRSCEKCCLRSAAGSPPRRHGISDLTVCGRPWQTHCRPSPGPVTCRLRSSRCRGG
jgi:SAM-dependent methyltransferase